MGEWAETTVELDKLPPRPAKAPKQAMLRAINFRIPGEARLWIDDVMLEVVNEPATKK